MKNILLTLSLSFLALGTNSFAAELAVPGAGISSLTGSDWDVDGLTHLDGILDGANWQDSGNNGVGGQDWVYVSDGGQLRPGGIVQWNGQDDAPFGAVDGTLTLDIGSTMASDIAAAGDNTLVISEVTTGAGTFTLNGVALTATAEGQVLQWTVAAPSLVVGDALVFSSNDLDAGTTASNNTNVYFGAGPVGFSAEDVAVPEPKTWAMMFAGLAGLGFLAYRRRMA